MSPHRDGGAGGRPPDANGKREKARGSGDVFVEGAGKVPPRWATRQGEFRAATPEEENVLQVAYLRDIDQADAKLTEVDVRRVGIADLPINFGTMARDAERVYRELGEGALGRFLYCSSAAGLWGRGGGVSKGTVPINLMDVLDADPIKLAKKIENLIEWGRIVSASSYDDVMLMSEKPVRRGKTTPDEARRILRIVKKGIQRTLKHARADPRGMPPPELKFANVALNSRLRGEYIPLTLWTSEQGHETVFDHIAALKRSFTSKRFHPDKAYQLEIVRALEAYFLAAEAIGDTHIFGHQVGYHAFHPETGEPDPSTARIGLGAGQLKAYFDATHRTVDLLRRGKDLILWENLEILNDLSLVLGAHVATGKQISAVYVPQRKGYMGGNPFWRKWVDGLEHLEAHEQTSLIPPLRADNELFLTNTLVFDTKLPPSKRLGWEPTKPATHRRVKQNAADLTLEVDSGGIVGRIEEEYENLKRYEEYAEHGVKYVERAQRMYAAMVDRIVAKRRARGGHESPLRHT